MTKIKALYTAHAKATGGREGTGATDDGKVSVKLSTPKELGGGGGEGTNPEQLFAIGYAACFIGALKFVGGRDKVVVPSDASIDSSVGIGPTPAGFGLEVTLKISLPGIDPETADRLIAEAHKVCPYSNATRGNIEVTLIRA
ncbi:organic hydroperoxide resistance protein [Leptospira ilyithenensis]|uniref:Organic hydroperoxide resistance protein n=1 Tax=Leptospira ilyithenensis TaxID=2484901 RepID=A0A4V3JX88_9LEPT|nr:organic hydroperoxide resistance protein [Leptospira ilyithenensis]TGN09381.1 organic hydroperoxide resistance protein [Leptospira ilyithenensis]